MLLWSKFIIKISFANIEDILLAFFVSYGALRQVLGDGIYQRGSNITAERLRFDFSFHRKMTTDELARVSSLVNEAIQKKIDVVCDIMPVDEARESGAIGVFDNKYGDMVKVYTINGYSQEICGGPHAGNTGELGSFKLLKEESVSNGVRRIKAMIPSNILLSKKTKATD